MTNKNLRAALTQSNAEPQREALLAAYQSMENCQHKHHFNAMVMVERALADPPQRPRASLDVLQKELLMIISSASKGLIAPPRADKSAWVANEKADLTQSDVAERREEELREDERLGAALRLAQDAEHEIERLLRERDSALAALRTTQKQYEEMGERALEAERLAALAQSDAEPICKICGGSGYTRHLGRDNSEEVENCSCRQQSDAEPVAWLWRYNEPPSGPWTLIDDRFAADRLASRSDIDVEPLYTTLPRPDASAGLIEAAEMAEECASECLGVKAPLSAYALRDFAKVLRARAADRSEK